jgi:hypothetical protein
MPNSSPPLLRSFARDQVDIARVNVGRVAVDNEVVLNNIFTTTEDATREKVLENEGDSYLGVVDIHHSDLPQEENVFDELDSTKQKERELDTTEQQDEKLETVSNKYIPSKPYTPTGDDPYPNRTPLLSTN